MHFDQSFTLIELLVVIAIVGILAGIIIVSMTNTTDSARIAKAKVFASSMRNSMANSIVSEWKFDGTGIADGTAADASYVKDTWGSSNGTINGNPLVKTNVNCVFGSCLSFDGVDDYINFGTDAKLDILNEVSFEMWINPRSLSNCGLITKRSTNEETTYVVLISNQKLRFAYYGNNSIWHTHYLNDTPNINKWQHIVISFIPTKNKLYFYKDGTLDKIWNTVSSGVSKPSYPLIVGWDAGYSFYNGLIDDIRIYNNAIPLSQVKNNYIAGISNLFLNGKITKQEYNQKIAKLNNFYSARNK